MSLFSKIGQAGAKVHLCLVHVGREECRGLRFQG